MRQDIESDERSKTVANQGDFALELFVSGQKQRVQPIDLGRHGVQNRLTVNGAGVKKDVQEGVVDKVAQLWDRFERERPQPLICASVLAM